MSTGPVLALHIRATRNVGDLWSSPASYLTFGDREIVVRDVVEYLAHPNGAKPSLVLAGGGAWKRDLARVRDLPALRGVPKVAWGVGYTKAKLGPNPRRAHLPRAKGWQIYGHRDVGMEGRYVPCASCLHPAFDRPYEIQHETVYYGHGALMPLDFAKGLGPWMTNLMPDMDRAVAFLGSGEVVVTSSYHGAYWARLLGRHVALIPRGSKFWHLPPAPRKPWEPTPLAEHRRLTREMYADVLDLLEGRT